MTRRPAPWRSTDVVMSAVFEALAFLAIVGAWRWAARSDSESTQLHALVLASAALIVGAIANLALVVNGRRSITERVAATTAALLDDA